ncbi:hypothetical protein SAMN02910278_01273 [Peptostreptococcus sp. D1]|nr:hypothetical protein SAMN02910278_01273 [Peptostreptococcus sp. D1]
MKFAKKVLSLTMLTVFLFSNFYSFPKFNKIVYTQKVGDGIRLANN